MVIKYQTTKDVVQELKRKYAEKEFVTDKSGAQTVEIIGATFIADEPMLLREPNHEYIMRELQWYRTKSRFVKDIPGTTPQIWEKVSDSDGMINSNYGWCIFSEENYDQYVKVLKKLIKDPDSRQASMIYTRPSMHSDAVENGMSDFMCFPGETLVLSPEGDIRIKDLVDKINSGIKYPVYSVNFETNEREIKYAIYGKKTGKKGILRVHFDNGQFVDTTEDHRFFVRDRIHNDKQYYHTYDNQVRAKDLKPGMSMIKSLIYKNGEDHLRFKKPLRGSYEYKNSAIVHREYYKFMNPNDDIEGYDIHHIDENPKNNSIDNLEKKDRLLHRRLHMLGSKNSVHKIHDRKSQLEKMTKSLKNTVSKRDLSWYENKNKCTLEESMNFLNKFIMNNDKISKRKFRAHCQNNNKQSYFTIINHYMRFENLSFEDITTQNCKVERIEYLNEDKDVYDIEVEDNHNFFVGWHDDSVGTGNGVLVHNCTFANQFFIRDGKLVSHYIMRSNDSVFGYNNDYAWAKYVQEMLAKDLNVEVGDLIWTASSLHVYSRHFDLLED